MDKEIVELANDESVDLQPRPKPAEFEREWGITNPMPFANYFRDMLESVRKDPVTPRQMMAMLDTDGQARSLFRLMTLPIRAAMKNASFIAADGGEKEAEFISQMFTLPPNAGGMAIPFERIMEQILYAVFHGFAAFNQVYWVPERGPLKGKITLMKLAHRPQDTVTFLWDKQGHFKGLRQQTFHQGELVDVVIPRKDVFYFASQEAERPGYGKSYFLSAFYHYDMKVRMYYIMNLAASRAAVGLRLGKHPRGISRADKIKFEQTLADVGVSQYIAIPDDPGFDVQILKEAGNFDFMAYINHQNSQMSKSILAQFIDDSQGTSAQTTPMVDFGQKTNEFFVMMLRTIMHDIAAQINHYIIPKFIDWNFASEKYPRYEWGAFTDEQLEAIRYTFNELSAISKDSAIFTPELYRELEKRVSGMMALNVNWAGVEKREAEEKAAVEAQAKQLSASQQHLIDLHNKQSTNAQQNGPQVPLSPQFSDNQKQLNPNNFQ